MQKPASGHNLNTLPSLAVKDTAVTHREKKKAILLTMLRRKQETLLKDKNGHRRGG